VARTRRDVWAVVGVLLHDEVLEIGGADAGVGAYVVEVLESVPIAYGKEPQSIPTEGIVGDSSPVLDGGDAMT
jgi:hypothetical protein